MRLGRMFLFGNGQKELLMPPAFHLIELFQILHRPALKD